MSKRARPELTDAVMGLRNHAADVMRKHHLNIAESVTVWCVAVGTYFNCCREEITETACNTAFETFVSKLYELYLRKEEHHAD